ncbi:MAG: S8 family serine peptidase, partial [Bacteroidales bacterium]|nr:S8 family serine peptidase [Bacteroidales bacterium]
EYAEPHYLPEFLFVPNDPLLEDQYHLEKIMAYEAWDVHTGNSDVVIGITDSGTDIDHPDLIFQIAYNHNDPIDGIDNDGDGYIDNFRGWDLGCNDNYPQVDENNHGVWVSGISSAQVNNEIGIAGVAYDCKYLPIKISDSAGILTMAYEGIVYAADQGCNVINCSWGSERRSAFGQDIVDYAIINKDAVVVAACGNTNTLTSFYPASYDRVVSVAGTTINDEKWTPENTGTSSGSSFGYQVDISAPGTGYRTTNNGGGYNTLFGGTSFSAPIVAGVAAVVRSYYPNLNALQTAERLKRTADNIDTIQYNLPYAGKMGAGRVNMYNALTQEFTPSFVFENLKIEDDRDNYYQNSSLVKVKGKIINYLSEANNAVVVISTDCEHIELITNEIILGNVQASQVIDLDDDCINFTINEDAEFNTIVVLKLEFYADNYQSFQYIEVPIKPAFKVLDENNISIGIAGNGRLGYADNYAKLGVGMRYKNFEGLIYDCGLVIANSSNNVFCAIRQETDFLCIEYPNYVEPPIYGDKHISAKFNESLDIFSLGIEVVQNAYAWN